MMSWCNNQLYFLLSALMASEIANAQRLRFSIKAKLAT
jgi:hypothetical protein